MISVRLVFTAAPWTKFERETGSSRPNNKNKIRDVLLFLFQIFCLHLEIYWCRWFTPHTSRSGRFKNSYREKEKNWMCIGIFDISMWYKYILIPSILLPVTIISTATLTTIPISFSGGGGGYFSLFSSFPYSSTWIMAGTGPKTNFILLVRLVQLWRKEANEKTWPACA